MTFPRGDLPPIQFAEKSATEIQAEIINTYENLTGRSLAQGDPVRLFLLAVASVIINQRNIIDFAAKQNLLSYAQDTYLDFIGELVGVTRLEATPALTTIRFTLSTTQGSVYTIAAGTRVSAGNLEFATTEVLEIPIGNLTGDVPAACITPGTIGNDLLPGQIRTLVAPLPFVQGAVNTTSSTGGADREGDESMVDRIRLAPSAFTVAGPRDAYIYWALTANQAIIDVAVSSPSPGVVDVRPLLEGGAIPDQDVLDQVDAVLSSDNIRPLTDLVQVGAPSTVSYNINVDFWIKSENAAQSLAIQNAVTAAVNDYILWQKTRIGRDINPDQLLTRMINAGAKRVVITSPSFTVLDDTEVAAEDVVTVTYQGTEDA
jgi:phage-related baseplate assembly protein